MILKFFAFTGIVFYVVKSAGNVKPALNVIICTETYYRSWDDLEAQKGQGEILFLGSMFFIYLGLIFPLYQKRKQNEKKDKELSKSTSRHRIPKSLESLFLNFLFVVLGMVAHGIFFIMNQ